ncbi:MAG: hypothetical protein QN189_10410 [Armatimonadota bacterium]|nr:hypothetical protein [Armatimonadota bacterium]
MKWFLLLVAIILVMAMPAVAQVSSTIVAGQSVGSLRIGAPISEAISLLGDLYEKEDSQSGKFTSYDWPLTPFFVVAEKESGRIVLISVWRTSAYRTDRGITGGSRRDEVTRAYGNEFQTEEGENLTGLIFDRLGIAFFLGKRGVLTDRVVEIVVFAPGRWKEITEE